MNKMDHVKKIAITGAATAVMLGSMAGVAGAHVNRVGGDWMLNAPSTLNFYCLGNNSLYPHTLNTVDNNPDGSFNGTGSYDNNTNYTWDVDGNINGDSISLHVVYTGLQAGSVYNLNGTIAPDGSISGSSDSNCQSFEMPAGTASRFESNHGQWVRSQENKQEAAHERVGMPVQSKGHTK